MVAKNSGSQGDPGNLPHPLSPTASVIIVNWNGERFLDACLSSLATQTRHDFEVILVDNGSTDGSLALVEGRFPGVRVICNPANLGFAAANNIGIKAARGRYLVTLNNDTHVTPGWLDALCQAVEGDGQVGSCASKMLLADDPASIDSTGICLNLAGIAWDRCGGQPSTADIPVDTLLEIFGPSAGAALYRREMLESIGLFEDEFFAYLEDVDLAWRARLAGWRCLYVPAAIVYHYHSGTGKEGSPFKNWLLGRNKVWSIALNYHFAALLLYLPLILFYDGASVAYNLLIRRDSSPLKGRLAGLVSLPRIWRKRRLRLGSRAISFATFQQYLTPLDSPLTIFRRYRYIRAMSAARQETPHSPPSLPGKEDRECGQ